MSENKTQRHVTPVAPSTQHPLLENAFATRDELLFYCREQLKDAQSKTEIWAAICLVDQLLGIMTEEV